MPKGSLGLLYDPFTQLTSFINEDNGNYMLFQYGGNKQRVLKREQVGQSPVPNATMYIHGMPARHASPFGGNAYPLTEKYNEHGNIQDRMYIYGPTGLLAMVRDGISFYVIKDHLGSTRVVVNGAGGGEVERYDYTPFGEVIPVQIDPQVHYRFTGQELDEFSNGFSLHNFRARMYDSDLGRFYAIDPAGQGWSPFAYAGNSPVIYVDKDGRIFGIDDLLFAAILVAGAYTGGAIANENLNPFQWDWSSSSTWVAMGVGAFSSGFIASGIAVGGAYGTAVGGSVLNTASGYLSGVAPEELWKSALAGFGTSYFAATGGFGLAEKGWAGRLATQVISTSSRSIGNNWAEDRGLFSGVRVGIGPVTLRLGEHEKLLNFWDNAASIVAHSIGFTNYLTSRTGEIEFDEQSFSLNFKGGWIHSVLDELGIQAIGPYAIFDATAEQLVHEGHHVRQSRFFEKLFIPGYFLNSLFDLFGGRDPYLDNFFEQQARSKIWYR